MISKKKLNTIVYIITVIFSIIFIYAGNKIVIKNSPVFNTQEDSNQYKARILKILDTETETYNISSDTTIENTTITFTAMFLSGENRGREVTAIQQMDNFTPYSSLEIKEGDKILLYKSTGTMEGEQWVFAEHLRTDMLVWLCIIFIIFLIIFGRTKGINTVVSLGFTCAAVFAIFIPSILSGYNVYITSTIICLYTIIMTLIIVNGIDKKTLCSIIGCFSGVLLAGLLTLVMSRILKLTGMLDEKSIYLTYLETPHPISLKGIIFGAITIGAMGAIMDVAMSVSSALYEIRLKAKNVSFSSLVQSGFTIGRDMMGTMANTLVLAYIGSSLSGVLLLVVYNSSILGLLNREMVVVEILQSLVGSIGILFTIPFTSIICGLIYTRGKNADYEYDEENENDINENNLLYEENSWSKIKKWSNENLKGKNNWVDDEKLEDETWNNHKL